MTERREPLRFESPTVKWADALKQGDRFALSRLLTFAESKRFEHRELVDQVLELGKGPSTFRVAVTGAPGAGKSTLLETLGLHLIREGHRVAVLTIDPSSPVTGGSLLADKTRMSRLSVRPEAFIRPVPSGASFGGVSPQTQKCLDLCECANFDVVFLETVGVGQTELDAWALVDCLLLLISPAAGDEMQGLKRGLMEHVDLLAITKAELEPELARRTLVHYSSAFKLLRGTEGTGVSLLDGMSGSGVVELWSRLLNFRQTMSPEARVQKLRRQRESILWREVDGVVRESLQALAEREPEAELASILEACRGGQVSPVQGAHQVLGLLSREMPVDLFSQKK